MKKVLVVLMVLLFTISFMVTDAQATSGTVDTGDVLYTAPYSETFTSDIVPNVQLLDPGSIKVTISWSSPSLSFDKKLLKDTSGNDVRYYALKTPQTVEFRIENNSLSGTSFDGTVYVIPAFLRTNVQESQSSNIKVLMTGENTELSLVKGSSVSSVKLDYSNVLEQYLATDMPGTLLSGSASAQAIKDIMTMNVTFSISTTKR